MIVALIFSSLKVQFKLIGLFEDGNVILLAWAANVFCTRSTETRSRDTFVQKSIEGQNKASEETAA